VTGVHSFHFAKPQKNKKKEKKLLIGCIKNPVGKATNGRDMKKIIFYTQ